MTARESVPTHDVTGSMTGAVTSDPLANVTTVRFSLKLRTVTEPRAQITLANMLIPDLRTWGDLPGTILVGDDVDLSDGAAIPRSGSGEVTCDEDRWLITVDRAEFEESTEPGRIRVRLRLVDQGGERDPLEVHGTLDVGPIRVRTRDRQEAERLLDLAGFDISEDADGLDLRPQAGPR